jgi:hypothetical protein
MLKNQKDFFSGLVFTAIGVAFALGAKTYQVGDAARMGPGYFPLMLGIILALMGIAITISALLSGPPDAAPIGKWAWKPLSFVLMANVAFGALLVGVPSLGIPGFGLVVAIFALVAIASLAGDQFIVKEVLILSAILSVGSYLAFIKLLALQFPVWPSFITG